VEVFRKEQRSVLRRPRSWRRLLEASKVEALLRRSTSIKTRTLMIYAVFWRGAPLQDMAVGTMCAPSHFTSSQESSRLRREGTGSQTINDQRTVDFTHTNLLNNISLIPCVSQLPTAGRLPHCIRSWQCITGNQWVLQAVNGYKLELVSPPVQGAPPLASGTGKADLIEEEVQKLLRKDAIKVVPNCHGQFLSRIFLVPKKDGSFRPVVNLRPLNRFMESVHFKMESLGMMRDLPEENDWMASIDLKDAYLSVAIWEEHWKYLRFPWERCTNFSASHLVCQVILARSPSC